MPCDASRRPAKRSQSSAIGHSYFRASGCLAGATNSWTIVLYWDGMAWHVGRSAVVVAWRCWWLDLRSGRSRDYGREGDELLLPAQVDAEEPSKAGMDESISHGLSQEPIGVRRSTGKDSPSCIPGIRGYPPSFVAIPDIDAGFVSLASSYASTEGAEHVCGVDSQPPVLRAVLVRQWTVLEHPPPIPPPRVPYYLVPPCIIV